MDGFLIPGEEESHQQQYIEDDKDEQLIGYHLLNQPTSPLFLVSETKKGHAVYDHLKKHEDKTKGEKGT